MNTTQELEKKPIGRLLFQYSMPSVIAMLVNSIYNIVDRIFISHYVGEYAFAGLTIAFPLMLITFAITNLVGIGGASLFSIALGQQDYKKSSHIFTLTMILAGIITSLTVIAGLLFSKPLLVLSGGSNPAILTYAVSYFRIILFGFVFQMYSFVLTGFIRGENHPKLSMVTVLTSAITNIILDYIFIALLDMGVKGAALATVIGQASGFGILLIFYLRKKSIVKITKACFKINFSLILRIITIGFSSFVSVIGVSFSVIILNNVLQTYGGDSAIASMGAINSLFTFFIMPTDGIVQAMQPIVGYNYGASLYHRVLKTLKLSLITIFVFSTTVFLFYEIFPGFFMGLFLDSNSDTMDMAIPALRLFIISMPFLGIYLASVGYFQAIGKGIIAFILGLLRPVVFLIPIVLIFPAKWGLTGAWLTQPTTDILAVICCAVALSISYSHLKSKHSL